LPQTIENKIDRVGTFIIATYNQRPILTMLQFMVFNATFNTIVVILWWSVLFVEETLYI